MRTIAILFIAIAAASFAQTSQQPARPDESARTPQEWRQEYRQLLQQGQTAASGCLNYVRQQQQLGAKSDIDIAKVETIRLNLERELAAFDGGLIPEQPRAAATTAAIEARNRYRILTKRVIELAEQQNIQARKDYENGKNNAFDVLIAELKLIEVRRDLAAFEAGFAVPR